MQNTGFCRTSGTRRCIHQAFKAKFCPGPEIFLAALIANQNNFHGLLIATMKARKSQKVWVDRRIAELEDDRKYCHPRWPQEEKYIKLEIKRVKSLPLLNSFGAWFYLDWIVLILIILTTATSVVYYYQDDSATRYLYTRTISIVNLLVWLRLLKYVRPFHGIGTLVIILGETVTDFLNWAFLFVLLLVPFTAGFWINFGAVSTHPVDGYKEGMVFVLLFCCMYLK